MLERLNGDTNFFAAIRITSSRREYREPRSLNRIFKTICSGRNLGMARRLGIILATAVVALLVMTDGAPGHAGA
jgi:hypothetical protein